MTRIRLDHISATSKSGAKLSDVSMEINDDEYICVLGPTGAGPTILMQVIAGLQRASKGTIYFDDIDVTHLPPEDRQISMVFEQFNLFPHLSVMENLLFSARMRREDLDQKQDIANEILTMVRLNGREDAISSELSGGMQQRVGVARAIVATTRILLLDQPYRALDAKIRAEMRMEVRDIVKGLKMNCIHATHETEEAMLVADKIAIFNSGKLEQFDTPDMIFKSPKTEFVATFLAESNAWDVTTNDGEVKLTDDISLKYSQQSYPNSYSRCVVRQHAIDLFFNEDVPVEWNKFTGKITKVRLLGEFIRIHVEVGSVEFIVRELLNPNLKDPFELIDSEVTIGFPLEEVKLF